MRLPRFGQLYGVVLSLLRMRPPQTYDCISLFTQLTRYRLCGRRRRRRRRLHRNSAPSSSPRLPTQTHKSTTIICSCCCLGSGAGAQRNARAVDAASQRRRVHLCILIITLSKLYNAKYSHIQRIAALLRSMENTARVENARRAFVEIVAYDESFQSACLLATMLLNLRNAQILGATSVDVSILACCSPTNTTRTRAASRRRRRDNNKLKITNFGSTHSSSSWACGAAFARVAVVCVCVCVVRSARACMRACACRSISSARDKAARSGRAECS